MQVVEDLEVQLGMVRQLYYNERASQLALSNLVREIHGLQDPEDIRKRIRALEDKIASQRQVFSSSLLLSSLELSDTHVYAP